MSQVKYSQVQSSQAKSKWCVKSSTEHLTIRHSSPLLLDHGIKSCHYFFISLLQNLNYNLPQRGIYHKISVFKCPSTHYTVTNSRKAKGTKLAKHMSEDIGSWSVVYSGKGAGKEGRWGNGRDENKVE